MTVGKKFQDFFRVVADGRQLDPLLFESREGTLQLDQLPLAERSPVRGTEEYEHGAFRAMTDLRVWFRPSWSFAEKAGTCWPTSGPVLMLWPCNAAIGSVHNIATSMRTLFAMQHLGSQNVNVSSSAIMMTGGPPDDIFAAWAKVSLPPVDSAHCWSTSIDGK